MDNSLQKFTPELVDEQVDWLLARQSPPSPDECVIVDLRQMYQDDEHSLRDVWQRLGLEESLPASVERQARKLHMVQSTQLPPASAKVLDLERKRHMRQSRKHALARRLLVLTAACIAILIVGSMLWVSNLTHQSQSSPATTHHPAITPSIASLPDPPDRIDTGPALNIIPSSTTTLRIDKNNLPLETDKVFTVNQTFYVTYTVQPPVGQSGQVSVKWYMNGQLDHVVTSGLIKGDTTIYGSLQTLYAQPTEGSVEIYWNDQLAERLYFVVRAPVN